MRALVASLVLVAALSACAAPAVSPGAGATGTGATGAVATGAAVPMATSTSTPTVAASPRAAFLSYVFTDVRDDRQFKLTDFPGRTVLVIGMAVW